MPYREIFITSLFIGAYQVCLLYYSVCRFGKIYDLLSYLVKEMSFFMSNQFNRIYLEIKCHWDILKLEFFLSLTSI